MASCWSPITGDFIESMPTVTRSCGRSSSVQDYNFFDWRHLVAGFMLISDDCRLNRIYANCHGILRSLSICTILCNFFDWRHVAAGFMLISDDCRLHRLYHRCWQLCYYFKIHNWSSTTGELSSIQLSWPFVHILIWTCLHVLAQFLYLMALFP